MENPYSPPKNEQTVQPTAKAPNIFSVISILAHLLIAYVIGFGLISFSPPDAGYWLIAALTVVTPFWLIIGVIFPSNIESTLFLSVVLYIGVLIGYFVVLRRLNWPFFRQLVCGVSTGVINGVASLISHEIIALMSA